jgi:flagellar motor switch protein FliN/FliY
MGGVVSVPDHKELADGAPQPSNLTRINSDLFRNVRVALEARLGKSPMTVEQIMALKGGDVVTLESSLADHVDLYLNDVLVARGEIVAVGDKFGVRIVDIAAKP